MPKIDLKLDEIVYILNDMRAVDQYFGSSERSNMIQYKLQSLLDGWNYYSSATGTFSTILRCKARVVASDYGALQCSKL